MKLIKVGFLISYDYNLLNYSLPSIYEKTDKIVLAIDKNRITWVGNSFIIEPSFFEWLKKFDIQNKIEVYEDNFYISNLTPMECEIRERNMLSKYMGEGGWHIQLDCDEYFTNFSIFVNFLHKIENKYININVEVGLCIIYKKLLDGYLVVNNTEFVTIATTLPNYMHSRKIPKFKNYLFPYKIIHDSWARNEHELLIKLNNWGHTNDFDINNYFNYWKSINENNYIFVKNFHPLEPDIWQGLKYFKSKNIQDLLNYFHNNNSELKIIMIKDKYLIQILKSFLPKSFIMLVRKILLLISSLKQI